MGIHQVLDTLHDGNSTFTEFLLEISALEGANAVLRKGRFSKKRRH